MYELFINIGHNQIETFNPIFDNVPYQRFDVMYLIHNYRSNNNYDNNSVSDCSL